jgi:hypothetical protein
MLTHDALYVSIFSRLLDWPWVPVDMAATITGPRTRGLPYVEAFSNLVYESNVETRVGLLSRNVDVTKGVNIRHVLLRYMFCCDTRKIVYRAEGGHLQHKLQQ